MTADRYKTVIVTGAAGFIGSRVVAHLAEAPNAPDRIVALDVREGSDDRVEWIRCDLADAARTAAILSEVSPDGIIHLAGVAGAPDLGSFFAANVQAAANLLAAAAALPRPPRVLVAGSAAQYGVTSGQGEVVDESHPLMGATPYAVTKTLQEKWALVYAAARTLPVTAVRLFNVMGPGQPPSLVPAAFLHQVAEVLDGRAAEVRVGNTMTRRDFLDARDVAAALCSLMNAEERAEGQVFNVASGEPVRIADMLDACLRLAGRAVPVRQDPARLRITDVETVVGDARRLRTVTGWQPAISWQRSLADSWQWLRTGRGGT